MAFLKSAFKWVLILGGIYIVSQILSGLDFETRIGWIIFGLGLALAYVDGSQNDRIAALEDRIIELERLLEHSRR